MSNNTIPTSQEEETATWNIPQLFHTLGIVSLMVGGIIAISKVNNASENKDSDSRKTIMNALVEKRDTFQGLPIIRIGNLEEIHTLRSSGKDGWYVFQEGNTVTYWKIKSGIVESNTYTTTQ